MLLICDLYREMSLINLLLNKNPFKKIQSDTLTVAKHLYDEKYLSHTYNNQLIDQLIDTMQAKAYGLPKIHKENAPLRPVISLVNSITHFQAKNLYNELKKCVKKPLSHINNSFELKDKLRGIIIDDSLAFVSLDVLFIIYKCTM